MASQYTINQFQPHNRSIHKKSVTFH